MRRFSAAETQDKAFGDISPPLTSRVRRIVVRMRMLVVTVQVMRRRFEIHLRRPGKPAEVQTPCDAHTQTLWRHWCERITKVLRINKARTTFGRERPQKGVYWQERPSSLRYLISTRYVGGGNRPLAPRRHPRTPPRTRMCPNLLKRRRTSLFTSWMLPGRDGAWFLANRWRMAIKTLPPATNWGADDVKDIAVCLFDGQSADN